MNNKRLLALFGLKWNPFLPNIPVQSLWPAPGIDTFLFQIENLVMDGGFALMGGEPGLGKSKNLQYLAHKLECLENVVVGVMERPQSSLADFYREMGELFGVNLTPSNRYGGFKALRERWRQLQATCGCSMSWLQNCLPLQHNANSLSLMNNSFWNCIHQHRRKNSLVKNTKIIPAYCR